MAEPSAILADALNGVTQATFKAVRAPIPLQHLLLIGFMLQLRAYEQRSRKGVGEKEREVEDLTAERDEALDDAARLRKQQGALVKEVEQLKAEVRRVVLWFGLGQVLTRTV